MKIENTRSKRVETQNGWILYVSHQPWEDNVRVDIAKRMFNGSLSTASIGEDGHMTLTERKEGEQNPPFMVIPYEAWSAFQELFSAVTPNIDAKEIDAELKATKFHLEDMRNLVFKNNKK